MGEKLLLLQQQGAASEVQGLRHLEEEPLLYSKRREDVRRASPSESESTPIGPVPTGASRWAYTNGESTITTPLPPESCERRPAGLPGRENPTTAERAAPCIPIAFILAEATFTTPGRRPLPSPAPLRWENTPTLRTHPDPLSLRIGNI